MCSLDFLRTVNDVSAISMEDYAVATLDEIEKRQFLNKRFTVGY
jgi:putative NADH-flavin reductase